MNRITMRKPFTGWHMTAILVAFFGVVIAVNFTMASLATGTFGGVVVENSYVASQSFNDWLDQADAQEELGWGVDTGWRDDQRLSVTVSGAPDPLTVTAIARHPLGQLPDRELVFARHAQGLYVSTEELPAGRWILRLRVRSGEHEWRGQEELQ